MKKLATKVAAVSVLALTPIVLFVLPAHGAGEIQIDHIEMRGDGRASLLLAVDGLPTGTSVDLESLTVEVDDEVTASTAESVEGGGIQRTIVLVLDTSDSMRGRKIEAAKTATEAFMATAPEDVSLGLVAFAGTVQDMVEPTTNHDAVGTALQDVALTRGTKVYDAIAEAIQVAGDAGARSLLVLSDGADTGSTTALDDLIASAKDAGVVVDSVALNLSSGQDAPLQRLAEASGGSVVSADPAALGAVFEAQADALASQIVVSFDVPENAVGEASIDVSLDAGGSTVSDSAFVRLDRADDGENLPTVSLAEPLVGRDGFFAGVAALGLGLAVLLAVVLGGGGRKSLSDRRLKAYLGQSGTGVRRKPTAREQVSLKESAVDMTARLVQGGFEDRLSLRLAGAGSSLRPAEWLLIHAGIAFGAAFVGLVLKGAAFMVVMLLVGAVLPWLWLKRRHSKRQSAFNAQLAETLTLMAGGLSAGLSLPQAVDTVVREGHEPMASELRRALVEQRLGVAIDEALDGVSERMESDDFAWVVMAIRIQREIGGNLAELLNTVADTLREREYLRRQVKVLSAEGRFSGYVLAGMPPVMFVYMLLVRPDFIRPLYTTPMGWMMVAVAVALLGLGMFVMSRIVKVEV